MSDSNADDSGFDKEAERERLREKYGDEEAERADTQRMSELLLKGATMTNQHCGECGDPIFRYEGRSFCPTCQEPRGDSSPAETATDTSGEQAPTGDDMPTTESREPDPSPPETPSEPSEPGSDRPDPAQAGPDETARPSRRQPQDGSSARPEGPRPAEGDVSEARASLLRTLTAMARGAEAADSIQRTRDHLEAAREAAEALEATDRLGRE
ncbi:MAG: Sjogren's syndrome/scleroderma autoantigen 1 family protein [Halobacteriaceae archaeon]